MKAYFLWLAKLLTLIVLFVVVVPALLGAMMVALQSQVGEGVGAAGNLVAVVELKGMIESSKEVVSELYKQADNKEVKGIVLRIDSPGGAVGPSQEIFEAVSKIKERKPVVASMGGVAASGGLYSALGASKIFCQPGTLTGSIGVILQMPNFSKVTERLGVDMVTIKSGALKDAGNIFRGMTEPERAYLQGTADAVHQQFIQAVVDGRRLEADRVREFADGRVLLGSQALDMKLVDGLGGVYEAAREVFVILGKPLKDSEQPELYYTEDKFAKFRKLVESVLNLPFSLQGAVGAGSVELRYVMQ